MRYVQGNNICDGDADLRTLYNRTPPTPVKQWEKRVSAAAKQRRLLCGSSRAPGGGWPCRALLLPAASPEAACRAWTRDAVDSSIVFSPLQEQTRKSAPCLRPAVRSSGARNVLHYWLVSSLPCAAYKASARCDH